MIVSKGLTKLGLVVASLLIGAILALLMPYGHVFADGPGGALVINANPSTVVTGLGLGAGISALVALIKATAPDVPARVLPLMVLIAAAFLVLLDAFSTKGDHPSPIVVALTILSQTISALGWREGLTALVPAVSSLPSRPSASPAT